MKLPVGARLPHDFADIPPNAPEVVQCNRALYRITHILSETPWSCLYRGKKVFRNFEFAKGTLTEAAEDECLDVLIRTLSYPQMDDRDYIKARREHSWFEAKQVLGCRHTNLIAEPLDYLEVRNDQDQFAFPRPGNIPTTEPVLVFETIHGDNLANWRQSARGDVARRLHVLGQMLEFLATLHDTKFLINVVGPTAFWVDDLHRVHFVGTENVVDERRAVTWRGLFPNERYAPGFVAPELLQPKVPPSRQSDLYGWAAMAWLLLTGDSPAQLAADQQQRWARFEPAHREGLRRGLVQFTPLQIAGVKRELNVEGTRFDSLWPDSFLDGLWSCLNVDAAKRPGSVADLRALWGNPPPPPVPACIVVRKHPAAARIAFSTRGLRGGTQFQISRRFAQPPLSPQEGDVAWRGTMPSPIEVVVPLPPGSGRGKVVAGEWCFSIFAFQTQGDITSVSQATEALNLDGTLSGFRRAFAESLAGGADLLPEAIPLLAELDPIELVAEELLDSSDMRVRGWAVLLLEQGIRAAATSAACRKLLEKRGLADVEYKVRQQAATVLIRTAAPVNVKRVIELAHRMGDNAVDDMIRAARGFLELGVSAGVIDKAIEALEQEHRIVVCAVCQQELRTRELDTHLTIEHHYVPLDGMLLSFGQALTRLWSRVLQHFDAAALQALTGHLQQRHPQTVVSAFASALSQQVLFAWQSQRAHQSDEQGRAWRDGLASCLRSDQVARSACWSLLPHDDSRIRELARSVLFIEAVLQLIEEHVTAAMFRRVVNELAPVPIVNERIEACRRLIELGANLLAGELCEQELYLERLIDCPECGTTFSKRDLERHRRKEHHVYEWDGQRYDCDTLISTLLVRTVAVEPDAFAARSLTELFVEQHGNGAWQPLYLGLRKQLLQSLQNEDGAVLALGLGSAVATVSMAPSLLRAFLKEDHSVCQIAGLAIFNNLDRDPPADLSRQAATLLGQAEIRYAVCQQVAIHLLRRPNAEDDVRRRALLALASRAADKLQGIELLRTLEQWVGPCSVIESVCGELLAQVRMTCPRCGVRLTPPELANHVLAEHGLVLDGRTVRKPWTVALNCLEEYAENLDSRLLERAEQLAVIASLENGRKRLWREALRRGVAPKHYRRALIESVKSTAASLCPECWESMSTRTETLGSVRIDQQGNIRSKTASLHRVDLHGIWGSVEISPWQGRAPRWVLSRLGSIAAIAVLFLVPSALFGVMEHQGFVGMQPFALGGFVLGLAGMSAAAVVYRRRAVEPIDVAWELVVPELLRDQVHMNGSDGMDFLASLASVSCGRGDASLREPILVRAIQAVGHLVRQGTLPPYQLGELLHLRWDDASRKRRKHGQREQVLNDLLRQVLNGQLPLACVDVATRNGKTLSRLQQDEPIAIVWRVIEDAKSAGLVPSDLMSITMASPTFGALLEATSVGASDFAELFAILDLEDSHEVPDGLLTARQLLRVGKRRLFRGHPTLLAQTPPNLASDSEEIRLSVDGFGFGGVVFTSSPDVTVIPVTAFVQTGWTHQRTDGGPDRRYSVNPPTGYYRHGGYTLTVGNVTRHYGDDPALVAGNIRRMARFLFHRLKPKAAEWSQYPTTPELTRILAEPASRCPHCQTRLRLQQGTIADRIPESESPAQ